MNYTDAIRDLDAIAALPDRWLNGEVAQPPAQTIENARCLMAHAGRQSIQIDEVTSRRGAITVRLRSDRGALTIIINDTGMHVGGEYMDLASTHAHISSLAPRSLAQQHAIG
jgi:hypothetical protein